MLPLFAFVNCEFPIKELSLSSIFSSVSIGCFLDLFIGKPLGIFSTMIIAKKLKYANLPHRSSRLQFLGIACLCGIGFTLQSKC